MDRVNHPARLFAFGLPGDGPERLFDRADANKRRKLAREQGQLLGTEALWPDRKQRCPRSRTLGTFTNADHVKLLGDQLLADLFNICRGHPAALLASGHVKCDIVKLSHRPIPSLWSDLRHGALQLRGDSLSDWRAVRRLNPAA